MEVVFYFEPIRLTENMRSAIGTRLWRLWFGRLMVVIRASIISLRPDTPTCDSMYYLPLSPYGPWGLASTTLGDRYPWLYHIIFKLCWIVDFLYYRTSTIFANGVTNSQLLSQNPSFHKWMLSMASFWWPLQYGLDAFQWKRSINISRSIGTILIY